LPRTRLILRRRDTTGKNFMYLQEHKGESVKDKCRHIVQPSIQN